MLSINSTFYAIVPKYLAQKSKHGSRHTFSRFLRFLLRANILVKGFGWPHIAIEWTSRLSVITLRRRWSYRRRHIERRRGTIMPTRSPDSLSWLLDRTRIDSTIWLKFLDVFRLKKLSCRNNLLPIVKLNETISRNVGIFYRNTIKGKQLGLELSNI